MASMETVELRIETYALKRSRHACANRLTRVQWTKILGLETESESPPNFLDALLGHSFFMSTKFMPTSSLQAIEDPVAVESPFSYRPRLQPERVFTFHCHSQSGSTVRNYGEVTYLTEPTTVIYKPWRRIVCSGSVKLSSRAFSIDRARWFRQKWSKWTISGRLSGPKLGLKRNKVFVPHSLSSFVLEVSSPQPTYRFRPSFVLLSFIWIYCHRHAVRSKSSVSTLLQPSFSSGSL